MRARDSGSQWAGQRVRMCSWFGSPQRLANRSCVLTAGYHKPTGVCGGIGTTYTLNPATPLKSVSNGIARAHDRKVAPRPARTTPPSHKGGRVERARKGASHLTSRPTGSQAPKGGRQYNGWACLYNLYCRPTGAGCLLCARSAHQSSPIVCKHTGSRFARLCTMH